MKVLIKDEEYFKSLDDSDYNIIKPIMGKWVEGFINSYGKLVILKGLNIKLFESDYYTENELKLMKLGNIK